jgi:hypothetical protein
MPKQTDIGRYMKNRKPPLSQGAKINALEEETDTLGVYVRNMIEILSKMRWNTGRTDARQKI